MNTITIKEAEAANYKPLTFPYVAGEETMLGKVVADMERDNIDYKLVETTIKVRDIRQWGVEVWRRGH